MTRPSHWLGPLFSGAFFGLLLIQGAALIAPASAQQASQPTSAPNIAISVSLSDVSKLTGDRFTFTSEITNNGTEATPPLIANLNFASLDDSTYIDPEDWSPQRTLTLDPIAPGASATQTWTINPILEGEVAAYIVILPSSASLTTSPLLASPAMHLHIGAQRSLNPGGVLPTVITVPSVLAVALAGLRITRERKRS